MLRNYRKSNGMDEYFTVMGSRGVFIALRKNLEFKILSPKICEPQGRYIILNIEMIGPYLYLLLTMLLTTNLIS